MKKQPTLVLFCGLPGSGKTTTARKLETQLPAVRLCPDEWLTDLGVNLFDEEIRKNLEIRHWNLARELLKQGQNVIVENGLWSRAERIEKLRDLQGISADVELRFMDVPFDELWRRVEARNRSGSYGTVPLTRADMEKYAGLFEAPDEAEMVLFSRVVRHRPD